MDSRTTAAVDLLQRLRTGRLTPPDHFPAECAPRDEAEAYAIQDGLLGRLAENIGGYKATLFDATHGLSAPILASTLLPSPATLTPGTTATRGTRRFGIEPEIAFRIGATLGPRSAAYGREEVLAAVTSAHAVLEICVCRLANFDALTPTERIADNFINEALVIGPAAADWQPAALAQLAVDLRVDGECVHRAQGAHPLGDPVLPLVWLANHLSSRGRALEAGMMVTTGSHAGIRYLAPGQRAAVQFPGFGSAAIDFRD